MDASKAPRTGRVKPCDACRANRKRCSQERPSCERCADRGIVCHYGGAMAARRTGSADSVVGEGSEGASAVGDSTGGGSHPPRLDWQHNSAVTVGMYEVQSELKDPLIVRPDDSSTGIAHIVGRTGKLVPCTACRRDRKKCDRSLPSCQNCLGREQNLPYAQPNPPSDLEKAKKVGGTATPTLAKHPVMSIANCLLYDDAAPADLDTSYSMIISSTDHFTRVTPPGLTRSESATSTVGSLTASSTSLLQQNQSAREPSSLSSLRTSTDSIPGSLGLVAYQSAPNNRASDLLRGTTQPSTARHHPYLPPPHCPAPVRPVRTILPKQPPQYQQQPLEMPKQQHAPSTIIAPHPFAPLSRYAEIPPSSTVGSRHADSFAAMAAAERQQVPKGPDGTLVLGPQYQHHQGFIYGRVPSANMWMQPGNPQVSWKALWGARPDAGPGLGRRGGY
ncbi:hypothetical protein BC830DRAFT_727491 [Chytriomyces sp. MP71]|nr:hypothetical protein BC830DRAFT_727491 [Chytriomyces sp. MP71]